MNIDSLLQSSPSDDHATRRSKAPPPPPPTQQQQQRPPLSSTSQPQPPLPSQQSRAYYPAPPSRGPPPPSSFDLRDTGRPTRERERDRERDRDRDRERDRGERDRDRDSILYAPVNEPSPMYTPPTSSDPGPIPARGGQRQHHQHPPPPPPLPSQQHVHQHHPSQQQQHSHAGVVPMSVTVERRHQHRAGHSHSHSHSQPPVQQGGVGIGGGGHGHGSGSAPPSRERERERENRMVDTAVGMDVDLPPHQHRPSLSPHRITHGHAHAHAHVHHGQVHTHTAHVHHPRASTYADAPAHHVHPHPHQPQTHSGHAHVLPQQHQHVQQQQQQAAQPPRPPSPPKAIKHLGTYTYPLTPFPYPFSARDIGCAVRLTLIVPRRALPDDAYAPRIWGGCAGDLDRLKSGGGGRGQVYTDDSDVVGAAVHAGFVRWSTLIQAREHGADLALDLELRPDVVRYVGGVGRAYAGGLEGEDEVVGVKEEGKKRNGHGHGHYGRKDEEEDEEDDGRGVVSAGWGNGHDGAGFEILRARLIPTGSAHGTRRARTLRLKEYALRRAEMMLTPRTMKRGYPFGEDDEEDAYGPEALARKAALVLPKAMEPEAKPTILLSSSFGWEGNVYRYDPTHLRTALFPPPPPKRTRKRPRRDSSSSHTSNSAQTSSNPPRTVILETACERFAVKPASASVSGGDSGGRWEIVLLGRFGKAAGFPLSRANSDYGGASPLPRSPLNGDSPSTSQHSLLTPYTNSNNLTAGPPTPNGEPSSNGNGSGSGLPPEYPSHDLTRSSFAFAPDELRVLGPPEPRTGARAGWALDVRRWWIEAPAPTPTSTALDVVAEAEEGGEQEKEGKEGERDVRMDVTEGDAEVVGSGIGGAQVPEPVSEQTATIERAPVRGAEGAVVPSAAAAADPTPPASIAHEQATAQEEERDVVPPGMIPPPSTEAEVQSSAQIAEEPASASGAVAEPAIIPSTSDAAVPQPPPAPAPADVPSASHPGETVNTATKDAGAAEAQADKPASPIDAARAMGFEPASAPAVSVPASTAEGEGGPATVLAPVPSTSGPSAPVSSAPVPPVATGEDVEDGEIASSNGEAPPPIGETASAAAPSLMGAGGAGVGMDVDA
ncbi:unnamed protein product [Peniophora sp. CBMAI 1063]|nr:unnamed protein product [Peniophora sp. CBMAI 1063]